MLSESTTFSQQSLLSEFTRTGSEEILLKLIGFKERGIRYYRNLIFNIIWDTVTNAYPIITDFLGEKYMKVLVEQFFRTHKCQTPQVWRVPDEFKNYITKEGWDLLELYSFLPDLLLFEWIEIEMYMMSDEIIPEFSYFGNFLENKLILNPEIKILLFNFPVHIKHPKYLTPFDKGEYLIAAHRHPESKEIIFTQLTAITAKIIELLYEKPHSYEEIINKFDTVLVNQKQQLINFLEKALENKIILGYASNQNC